MRDRTEIHRMRSKIKRHNFRSKTLFEPEIWPLGKSVLELWSLQKKDDGLTDGHLKPKTYSPKPIGWGLTKIFGW